MRLAAILATLASPALAESFVCSWETECYGTEPCQETGYETYLDGTETSGWTLSGEAGGTAAWEVTPPGPDAAPVRTFFVAPSGSNAASITLMLGADGEAAFTQYGYLEGITTATYRGRCESR